MISDAIIDELDYFNDHVWRIEGKATMRGIKDHVFLRSRWVMCNKGKHIAPDMRARLVACEVSKEERTISSMRLPLHSKPKSCYSPDMHQSTPEKRKPLKLSFVDMRNTYVNGVPRGDVLMSLPKNLDFRRTSSRGRSAVFMELGTLV